MDESGVKMITTLLKSGDVKAMTIGGHVVAQCFRYNEVARRNGTQLLDTLLTTFRSLVDPKHIVSSEMESSCLLSLSLALLRLASASVSDEETLRKEPDTRNVWKLLSASTEKKSRLFMRASPLLSSENVEAFESWQKLSVKKEKNKIQTIESESICELLSTCARSYASLLVLNEDCTQWIVRACVAMLFDPCREIRLKACDSIQRTYRSLGPDLANVFCVKILSSMKSVLDNLEILDTKACANRKKREEDAAKFRRSVGAMGMENDEESDKTIDDGSSCPRRAWIAQSLRSIVPSKPSSSLSCSLLLLTYHPRVNTMKRKQHTHPSFPSSNYFRDSTRKPSRNLLWLKHTIPGLENNDVVIKTVLNSMWGDDDVTCLDVFTDIAFVLSDSNIERFGTRAVRELREAYQDVKDISQHESRVYTDDAFRFRELAEIESLISVEGRPNKGKFRIYLPVYFRFSCLSSSLFTHTHTHINTRHTHTHTYRYSRIISIQTREQEVEITSTKRN